MRSRATISILLLVPFSLGAVLSTPLLCEDSIADFLLDGLAWLIFLLGATFRWWATLYVGGRKSSDLVTDGAYSACRNPIYAGTFLLTLSVAFFLHSVTFGIGLALATPIYLCITVSWEESRLRERFGKAFDAYCEEVPRLVPRLSRLRTGNSVVVSVEGLCAECRRTLCWVWIPFLAEAVAHLRMESWWPKVFDLP